MWLCGSTRKSILRSRSSTKREITSALLPPSQLGSATKKSMGRMVAVALCIVVPCCGNPRVASGSPLQATEGSRRGSSFGGESLHNTSRLAHSAADEVVVRVEPARWNPECIRDYRQCIARLPVCVRGGLGSHLSLVRFELGEAREGDDSYRTEWPSYRRMWPFHLPLPTESCGGNGVRYLLPGIRDSQKRFAVAAILVDPAGNTTRVLSQPFVLENQMRGQARQRCLDVGGQWKELGFAGRPGCLTPARDAGTICRAAGECLGACIFDKYESSSGDGGPTPDCTLWPFRPSSRCRPVGHCSEFIESRGCEWVIGGGPDNPASVRRICSD
jgi:hypothetical protein